MQSVWKLGAAILALLQLSAQAAPIASPSVLPLPADWYPESLAVSTDGNFYAGSWHQGAVARVRPDGSAPQVLVQPGSNHLTNAQGVLLDEASNTLWVCSGNIGYTSVPRYPTALKSYDLQTGAAKQDFPLPGGGHCNDLAIDAQHTLYVTDSLHPRVLRLRAGASALEVWKEDASFAQGRQGYYLNGIALDGSGAMYLSDVDAVDYLYRVEMRADGSAGSVRKIHFPRVLKNADAIRSVPGHRLVIFESDAFGNDGADGGQISLASLDGEQIGLRTLAQGLDNPCSGVVWQQRVYFIESKYSLLFRHSADDLSQLAHPVPFAIQSIALPD